MTLQSIAGAGAQDGERLLSENTERLALPSQLSAMAQLPVWVDALASRYSIPDKILFAINLCLEEAVSNVIRHGYAGADDGVVFVRFIPSEKSYAFVVEDQARHFNPLDLSDLPPLNPYEEMRVGGQGIRLMRRFANSIEYEPTPTGNRLLVAFSATGPTVLK